MIGSTARQTAMAKRKSSAASVKRERRDGQEQARNFHHEFKGRQNFPLRNSPCVDRKGNCGRTRRNFSDAQLADAIITVPAYFNDAERSATMRAGKLAGLNVIGVLNETTAAALAYDFRQSEEKLTVLVFDLGGGTLDVTIMEIAENEIRMLANHGDHRLGGKDWDDLICSWVAEAFESEHGKNPMLDDDGYEDLSRRSTEAKEQLSSRESVNFDYSYNGHGMRLELTRSAFEKRSRALVERCKRICEIGLAEARLEPSQIDGILLAGGMTHMPSVRAMLAALYPGARRWPIL